MAKKDLTANIKTADSAATKEWYKKTRPIFAALAEATRAILENQIKASSIDYLNVTGRAKSADSFENKVRQNDYKDPRVDVHDLAGIRVITYIESDAKRVSKIVHNTFRVHPDDSLDKSKELGVDRIGYRSMHFVCDLGKARCKLPEFTPFKDLSFEVQIRTVLQHAWAEIEHDRNYKFSGALPEDLQRRLNLAAGTLEMVDREFDALGNEIDTYAAAVAKKADQGDLAIDLNKTSLLEYLRNDRFRSKGFRKSPIEARSEVLDLVVQELRLFGVKSLEEVDAIVSDSLVRSMNQSRNRLTVTGLLRTGMIIKDIDQYFNSAWKKHWTRMPEGIYHIVARHWGSVKVKKVFRRHGVRVETIEEDRDETTRSPATRRKRALRKFKRK